MTSRWFSKMLISKGFMFLGDNHPNVGVNPLINLNKFWQPTEK
ncbi:hypothetical protein METHP14_120049 [Pseudomonas sp. P14-2025]